MFIFCEWQLLFSSFSADDEDYEGYDYALVGELSEVRVVYLNRFIQEVTCVKITWINICRLSSFISHECCYADC